jgi:hypothetical protein
VDEQRDQLLAVRRQAGERLAQRNMPLGGQQVLFGDLGMVVADILSVQRQDGGLWTMCRAQYSGAFEPGGGSQPPRQGVRIAEVVQLFHQVQPDALACVLGLGGAQPVPAADGPHQRRVPVDKCVPRLLVAGCGAQHQVGDRLIIAHRVPSFRVCQRAVRR